MNRQDDRAAAILKNRTRLLAERIGPDKAAPEAVKRSLIVISVGQSLFGIDIAEVAAVSPFEGCARMPMREPAVLGVTGRGGRFYSVISLRHLLTPAATADGGGAAGPAHLLLLRGNAPLMALAVDRVLGRFDVIEGDRLSGDTTFDLDGQLVALFDPETLRSRFGRPAVAAHP